MALTFESGTGRQLGQSSDIYGGGGTENMGYGMSPLESQARFGTQAFGGMSVYDVAQNQRDEQAAQIASAQIDSMMADPNIRQMATLNPTQYTGYLQEVARREQAAQQAAQQSAAQQAAAQALANTQRQIAEKQRLEQQARDQIVGRASMGFENLGAYGASPIQMTARYGSLAPSVMSYLGSGRPYSGLAGGLLGDAYSQLQSGVGQPVTSGLDAFGNPRVIGSLAETPFGGTVYSGRQDPDYTGAYESLVRPYDDSEATYRDDRPEVVGSITDSETGQERCPTGYMFDEDLQACRLDTGMGEDQRDDRTDATAAYARMGLLDVAPDFSGSAFGDGLLFDERNKMFRLRSATRPDIFRTRPSTIGMTEIS